MINVFEILHKNCCGHIGLVEGVPTFFYFFVELLSIWQMCDSYARAQKKRKEENNTKLRINK